MRCGSMKVILQKLINMNEVKKSPPKIKIQVAIKFPKKLRFRRILMDLAAEADADVILKCLASHDEAVISREISENAPTQDVITAFDEIRLLVSRLLAAQIIDAKNGDNES